MKTFSDSQFSNRFARVYMALDPTMRQSRWKTGDVTWQHDRHGFRGQAYAFQYDTHLLTCAGRSGWTLLYVNETWWDDKGETVVRSTRWGRILQGSRADAFAWFKAQEEALPR